MHTHTDTHTHTHAHTHMHTLASSPGSLTHSHGGRGAKRAWYTLFAHALIISVITRVGVILENIREYPSWVCTKILKYPKMYWRTCGCVAAHTTASDCLLGQSLAKLVAI